MIYEKAMKLVSNEACIVHRKGWVIDIRLYDNKYYVYQFGQLWKEYEPTAGDLLSDDWIAR